MPRNPVKRMHCSVQCAVWTVRYPCVQKLKYKNHFPMGEKGILSSHCTDAGPNDADQCITIFNFLWGYMIHDHRDDINKYKNKDKMHKRPNYFEKKVDIKTTRITKFARFIRIFSFIRSFAQWNRIVQRNLSLDRVQKDWVVAEQVAPINPMPRKGGEICKLHSNANKSCRPSLHSQTKTVLILMKAWLCEKFYDAHRKVNY